MRLPESLRYALERISEKFSPTQLREARKLLSREYRESGQSHSVFEDPAQRIAYLATRMPATYAAIVRVLQEIPVIMTRILDVGAGPGTASWAAAECGAQKAVLLEKNRHAIALGQELMKDIPSFQAEWVCQDLEKVASVPMADGAILSYSLGELQNQESLLEKVWHAGIPWIAIIEPGTPRGYQTILRARDKLLSLGAHIVAPCPHAKVCPLKKDDWCHFSIRLERTKLHRLVKEGDLGFEDEKFSYLVVSRKPVEQRGARILRHPNKGSGHVRLSLCASEGDAREIVVTRKEKELYRKARDAAWGDSWM